VASDRGGLSYRISVRDEFSSNVQAFVTGIRQAKAEFANFRAQVSGGRRAAADLRALAREAQRTSQATARSSQDLERALERRARVVRSLESDLRRSERSRARSAAQEIQQSNRLLAAERQRLRALQTSQQARERESRRILAAMRRDEADFQREQLRRIQELAQARRAAEQMRVRQAREAAAEQARLDRQNPVVQGQRRANSRVLSQDTARAELAELRRLGREDLVTKQLRRQAGELRDSAGSANKLLFTFRRLVGVLAAFTIARELVSGFRELVTTGVQFNDQLQRAEIGITGLISGLADVRNAQGNSVGLAEEFALAQGVARRQIGLLRQDALRTTATFEQLLDTFQVAVAPGFAAGLNIDEIRKLSVSISQAATAIGVPQNQLSEEIRSLLSGTIQARTTRIATALQITNADIRRLRATGELFDFLEERFQALGKAAEQAARQTLSGVGTLVRDALGLILGEAAQPLFEELLALGNELLDNVLTVRTAAGDIRPNPEAVAAFRGLFDALRTGVQSVREIGQELGFEGLRNVLESIGNGITVTFRFLVGFIGSIGRAFNLIVDTIQAIGSAIGLDMNGGLGTTAQLVGRLVADFLILRTSARLFGLNLTDALNPQKARAFGAALKNFVATPLGKGGLIGIGIAAVAKGFQLWVSDIFDVNLGLRETIVLLSLAASDTLDAAVTGFDKFIVQAAGKIKQAFTFDEAADAEIQQRVDALLAGLDEQRGRAAREALEQIAAVVNAARTAAGQLPGADAPAAPSGGDNVDSFRSSLSNVESVIASVGNEIGDLQTSVESLGDQFLVAGRQAGLSGFAGEIAKAAGEAVTTRLEKARQVLDALNQSEQARAALIKQANISEQRLADIRAAVDAPADMRQKALEALSLNDAEARLVSLLLDELRLQEAIRDVGAQAVLQARLKAGIAAREALPDTLRQVEALRAQLEAETALTAIIEQQAGRRRAATVEAQNALNIARQENRARLEQLQAELQRARLALRPVTGLTDPAQIAQAEEARRAAALQVAALSQQLDLETEIAGQKERGLAAIAKERQLEEDGSFAEGIAAGFRQLADDLPTVFEGARALIVDITNQISSAAAQAATDFVRSIADPEFETDFKALLGRLGLSVAQSIFQNIIDTGLQSIISQFTTAAATETGAASTAATARTQSAAALQAAAAAELAAAKSAAALRAGASASGGVTGGQVSPRGIGFAAGGQIPHIPKSLRIRRPRGLDPRDTVPAYLQPGEFVIRKKVVDSMGAGFFRAVNAGRFSTPGAVPSGEGSLGKANGGRVSAQQAAAAPGRGGDVMVVPAVVTSERELDRLQAAGRNGQLQFIRENAGAIRGILGVPNSGVR
jgi:hypothetical protein